MVIKRFIQNYIWFWKESFSFMEGYNKFYIAWGCLKKAHYHAIDMERWHRVQDKQEAYAMMDRRI